MNRIKLLRKEQNPKMSQEKLAKIMGVGRTTVTMWENGSNEPDNATLIRLADLFGVTVDYLIGNVNEPFFILDNDRILKDINSCGDEQQKKSTPGKGGGPSDKDIRLIAWFRSLPPEKRKAILMLGEAPEGLDE